jgi:hypothetical protein
MLVQVAAFAEGPAALRLRAVSAHAETAVDLSADGGAVQSEDAELRAFLAAAQARRPLRPGLGRAADALRLAGHVYRSAR